jgi:transposase
MYKTAKIKIRPECYGWLQAAAAEVNFVWNYCRWVSEKSLRDRAKPLSPFELINLTSGVTKADTAMRVGQATVSKVAAEYGVRRKQFKKLKLRYRDAKALGWIPVKPEQISKRKGNGFSYNGKRVRLYEDLPDAKLAEGSFAQDSVGDWYLCVPFEVEARDLPFESETCGIDLGLKATATTSGGEVLQTRFYRDAEQKIAQLQRRGHKRQAKRLHRKVRRQRDHALHDFSRKIVNKYKNIYIGDVNFGFLKSGRSAKTAYDTGMAKLKTQLQYKGQQANRWVQVVDEKYTTQACSACGAISGPKGASMLVVREWSCTECGTVHDRDINAAINIAASGMKYHPPFAGTSKKHDFLFPASRRRRWLG